LYDRLAIYVRKTRISEITGGKIDFELRVRVINLWSTPDRNNPGEEGAIHMIFLDERLTLYAFLKQVIFRLFAFHYTGS
jgi:hypothetical protein